MTDARANVVDGLCSTVLGSSMAWHDHICDEEGWVAGGLADRLIEIDANKASGYAIGHASAEDD